MKTRTFAAIAATMLFAATAFITVGVFQANNLRAEAKAPEYVSTVFPADTVIQVNVQISAADWQDIQDNPMNEEYHLASVQINGQQVDNVGIRAKGNSSLNSVANSDSERFSFKIDFDQFINGQSLGGLTKLNLNNNWSDQSSMREYLSYQAFAELGVPTPAMAYAQVSINGELWGLYLAVEGIEEPFLQRLYGEAAGALYKPEGTGADLKWRGDSISDYPGVIQQNNHTADDDQQLLSFLQALDTGENLEQYLDVDETLRYFAVSTALINFDSYQGQMLHNYYLYNEDGKFVILPWDLNMSFAGFSGASTVFIDEPTMGALADRPLIAKLLAVPEYLERYHTYLRQVAEGLLSEDRMVLTVNQLNELIRPYIALDPTKFYSLEQYDAAVSGKNSLIAFAKTQATSILQQLSGALPSTNNGQGSASGAMKGGGGGGMPAGNLQPPAAGGQPGLANLPAGVDMQAIRTLLEKTRGGSLSEADKAKLLEMGLTEEMITQLTQLRGGQPINPGQTPQPTEVAAGDPGAQAAQDGAGAIRPGQGWGQVRGTATNSLLTKYARWLTGGLVFLQLIAIVCVSYLRRKRFVI